MKSSLNSSDQVFEPANITKKRIETSSFSVQFITSDVSNSGLYIEFKFAFQHCELNQEPSQWFIFKRYSDFLKLHNSLLPIFRKQTSLDKVERYSMTTQEVPIQPTVVNDQSKEQLRKRGEELESYLNVVLNIMAG